MLRTLAIDIIRSAYGEPNGSAQCNNNCVFLGDLVEDEEEEEEEESLFIRIFTDTIAQY